MSFLQVDITFVNKGATDISIFWVNFEGHEVAMGPIEAGKSSVSKWEI
jgi:hypothetical protein